MTRTTHCPQPFFFYFCMCICAVGICLKNPCQGMFGGGGIHRHIHTKMIIIFIFSLITLHNYCVFDIIYVPIFITVNLRLVLHSSSGKALLSSAQFVQLVPISRHQHQHKRGYTNQPQHEPSVRVITNMKNIKTFHTLEAQHLCP